MTVLNKRRVLLLILRRRLLFRKKKEKKRRFLVGKIFTERKQKGEFYTLVEDLKLFDIEYFFKQFRMTPRKLEELLGWVAPRILKSNVKREAISPEERLCVTLRMLLRVTLMLPLGSARLVSVALLKKLPRSYGMYSLIKDF